MTAGLRRFLNLYFIHLASFLILIVAVSIQDSYAQLKFENLQSFELEISGVTDLSNPGYWRLSPNDRDIGSLFGISEILEDQSESGHFVIQDPGGTFLAYRYHGEEAEPLLQFNIENQSERMIDNVEVSLDLTLLTDGEQASELWIRYKIDHHEVEERLLRSGQFRGRSDNWQTTSLTTRLENLLMEPNEILEIQLIARGQNQFEKADAFGIQRVVLRPSEIELRQEISTGDLIISEIFPGYRIIDEPLHYLEIYNSSNKPIDLRGLLISNGTEEYRIRESHELQPYRMAIIANRDLATLGLEPDLTIHGFWLPSHGGMIELHSQGERIMRAAYDEQIEPRAWEIDRMAEALGGYTSMSNYRHSDHQIVSGIYGSPGEKGSSVRVFTKKMDEDQNWIFSGAPGSLVMDLNRVNSYRSDNIESTDSRAALVSGSGFLLNSNQAIQEVRDNRLIAIEQPELSETVINLEENSDNSFLLLGNPYPESVRLSNIRAEAGSLRMYSAQKWDPETGSFRLLNPDDSIEPWQAFVIQNNNAESIRILRDSQRDTYSSSANYSRSRYIQFDLRTSGSRDRGSDYLTDSATMLYFHEGVEDNHDAFHSRKLWPVFQESPDAKASLLYFISYENNRVAPLARTTLPFEPENIISLSLGHVNFNTSGTHSISWDEWYNIPDDWELILLDHRTGIEINMRDQNDYSFEAGGMLRELPRFSDEPSLHPVELQESHERFTIKINTSPHLTEQNDERGTQPDRVELYQNYPNPFNPATNIRFFLPEQQSVSVAVYNVVGQRVAQLMDDVLSQGEHTVVWDASDMPSGIYIIHLELGNRVLTRKMTLIK